MSVRLGPPASRDSRPADEPTRADSYLDALAGGEPVRDDAPAVNGVTSPAALTSTGKARPPGAPSPGRSFRTSASGADAREWKLSARLDHDLLAELYGAADQLADDGATVSGLVEEAIRLYLPRLRAQHNQGRPFSKGGRRRRSRIRHGLVAAPPA